MTVQPLRSYRDERTGATVHLYSRQALVDAYRARMPRRRIEDRTAPLRRREDGAR